MNRSRAGRWARRAVWGALLAVLAIGCNPFMVTYYPMRDDKVPAPFPLAFDKDGPKKNKDEVVVALLPQVAPGSGPQFASIASELAEKLARQLPEMAKESKDKEKRKVKVLSQTQVDKFKTANPTWEKMTPGEVGQKLGADFVLEIRMDKIRLYQPHSDNCIYEGRADLFVSVYEIGPDAGELKDKYPLSFAYPKTARSTEAYPSESAFKALFIENLAAEVAKMHVDHKPSNSIADGMRDDKLLPAPFPLAFDKDGPKKNKDEVVVALLPQVAPGSGPQFASIASELAEKLARQLPEMAKENKDKEKRKVKVLSQTQVDKFKMANPTWKKMTPGEIGQKLGADFVLEIRMDKIRLYQPHSDNCIYEGRADLFVSVYEIGPDAGELKDKYPLSFAYPKTARSTEAYPSESAFKALFIENLAAEVAKMHVDHKPSNSIADGMRDDKLLPAPFPLAFDKDGPKKNKDEVVVALLPQVAPGSGPQFASIASELAEKLARQLPEMAKESKDKEKRKVKVLSQTQVDKFKTANPTWEKMTPGEVGQKLGADFVLEIRMDKIRLYQPHSDNCIYEGRADLFVSVYEIGPDAGELKDKYPLSFAYPKTARSTEAYPSESAFKALFIENLAAEVAKMHVDHKPSNSIADGMRDDKLLPAPFPLAFDKDGPKKNKDEVVVALLPQVAPGSGPQFASIASELAEKLARQLPEMAKENKDKEKRKVKVLSQTQVDKFKTANPTWEKMTPGEVGQKLGADFVLEIRMDKIRLYQPHSDNCIYEGRADLFVSVYEIGPDAGELKDKYPLSFAYPKTARSTEAYPSESAFKALFIENLAAEVAKMHVDHKPSNSIADGR